MRTASPHQHDSKINRTNHPCIEGGIDASLSAHGYLVNGPIDGANLVIDNNEIMARNNGATSELYLNANGGNVGVNVATPPTAKLHVKGSVRFQGLPTASDGFLVGIDASGNLFRNVSPSANSLLDNKSAIILEEQTELIKTKSREITDLKTENDYQNEIIEDLQVQVSELKSLVEQLLTERTETPKNTNLILLLEQKALLRQNQPNPFRENTVVDYFVPADVKNAHIQVTSVDGKVLGQVKITELGKGQVTIQSKSYPSGTYYYSLVLDGQVMETKQMVLAW
ncbi:MAG: T9SS type A sorting domain-containing protein [Saprospiraceae bacterium]